MSTREMDTKQALLGDVCKSPHATEREAHIMTREELVMKFLTAPPEELARWYEFAENKSVAQAPADRRLLTLAAAAKVLNLSRQTVLRMSRDGRLPVVETRAGRFRVPSYALTDLLKGGAK